MIPALPAHVPHGPYERLVKRPLDFCLAFFAIVVLSPVLCIVAALVRCKLGSPVLFAQDRPGLVDPHTGRERIFRLFKFRSMTDARDSSGEPLPDELRLPPFGRFLRSTSLDELPELFNILRGDMAVVGPRPLHVKYLPYYSGIQRTRHQVRPGLTGRAQVHGRNDIDWDVRLEMDVAYASRITFAGDAAIVVRTFWKVFRREGISSADSATMEDFRDYCARKGRGPAPLSSEGKP